MIVNRTMRENGIKSKRMEEKGSWVMGGRQREGERDGERERDGANMKKKADYREREK
jgi:hypothetical protein